MVCDVRPEATTKFVDRGAVGVGAVGDVVGAGASIISVMVLDDAQVTDVVHDVLEVAPAGTIVAIHSTIRPETAESLAAEAEARDVWVLDAPVTGGPGGARAGTLAVMVGGPDHAVDRCRAPFDRFSDRVVHFGSVGCATRAKIARNLITFAGYVAAGEAQRLAEAAGVDLAQLGDVVRYSDTVTGGPGSIMLRDTAAAVPPDDPWHDVMQHTRDLGEKDLALALELAAQRRRGAALHRPGATAARAGARCPTRGDDEMTDESEPTDRRRRGLETMQKVYGWDTVGDGPGDFFGITADHLFGDIWNREGLSFRDRRLLLIGLLTGLGEHDVTELQLDAALGNQELSADELREVVIFLTHYAGWPRGTKLNTIVEKTIARRSG